MGGGSLTRCELGFYTLQPPTQDIAIKHGIDTHIHPRKVGALFEAGHRLRETGGEMN